MNPFSFTQDRDVRMRLTNDLIALFQTVSYAGLVAAGAAGAVDLTAVPQDVLYAFTAFTGTAIVWTFGVDAIRAWKGNGDTEAKVPDAE